MRGPLEWSSTWEQLAFAKAMRYHAGLEGILELAESLSLRDTLLAADLDVSKETASMPAMTTADTVAAAASVAVEPF